MTPEGFVLIISAVGAFLTGIIVSLKKIKVCKLCTKNGLLECKQKSETSSEDNSPKEIKTDIIHDMIYRELEEISIRELTDEFNHHHKHRRKRSVSDPPMHLNVRNSPNLETWVV